MNNSFSLTGKKKVFFLGAGTSADYGAPTFSNFISKAQKIRYEDSNIITKRFDNVLNFHKKNFPNFNIEQFYAWIDLETEIQSILNNKSALEMKNNTLYLITKTINNSLGNKINKNTVNFIGSLMNEGTIINFNWDLIIDRSFFQWQTNERHPCKINYGYEKSVSYFDEVKKKEESNLKILKLHGSLNWLVCRDCLSLYYTDEKVYDRFVENMYSNEFKCKECKVSLNPWIVPPTFTKFKKELEYKIIKTIWKHTHESLMEAKEIYIMGYSFPVTDAQFEIFFINSMLRNNKLKKVYIVTSPKYGSYKQKFEDRYSSIFKNTEHHGKLKFIYKKFNIYLEDNTHFNNPIKFR